MANIAGLKHAIEDCDDARISLWLAHWFRRPAGQDELLCPQSREIASVMSRCHLWPNVSTLRKAWTLPLARGQDCAPALSPGMDGRQTACICKLSLKQFCRKTSWKTLNLMLKSIVKSHRIRDGFMLLSLLQVMLFESYDHDPGLQKRCMKFIATETRWATELEVLSMCATLLHLKRVMAHQTDLAYHFCPAAAKTPAVGVHFLL